MPNPYAQPTQRRPQPAAPAPLALQRTPARPHPATTAEAAQGRFALPVRPRTAPAAEAYATDERSEPSGGVVMVSDAEAQLSTPRVAATPEPIAPPTATAPVSPVSLEPTDGPQIAWAEDAPTEGAYTEPLSEPATRTEPVEPAEVMAIAETPQAAPAPIVAPPATLAQGPDTVEPLLQPARRAEPAHRPAPAPLARVASAKPFPQTEPSAHGPVAGAPPIGERAKALLTESHELAQTAESYEQYTAIVQRCRYVLAIDQSEEGIGYANQLASWALNKRGETLDDQGRYDEAENDFLEAVRFDTDCWRAIHNLGVLEARSGKHAAARHRFDKTIDLNPEFAKAYSNRAALAVQEGDFDEALLDYQRAIERDPDLAVAHTGRGRVFHMLGRLDEALRHLDAARLLAPEDALIATGRGDLLVDLGRYGQAKQAYQRAIGLDPGAAQAHRNLAWLQATCPVESFRDPRLAVENATRAVELSAGPDDITLDTLAAALAAAGRFDEAAEAQQRAIELAPESEADVYRERLAMYGQGETFISEPVVPVRQASYQD